MIPAAEPGETDRADDELAAEAEDYRTLRDKVIELFNPPDLDIAEIALMCDAVTRAAKYIESIDCTCSLDVADYYDDPCQRCAALGLVAGVREER